MSYLPLYRVRTWPADDPEGTATTRVVLDGTVRRDMFEPVAEFSFTTRIDAGTLPDEWAAFASQWIQRGTWVECQVTSDGSFEDRFTFLVDHITTPPTTGAVYTHNGATYTFHASDLSGSAPDISGTITFTRSVTTDDPLLGSQTLTKSSGTGDATITFNETATGQGWRPHVRAIFYGPIWEWSAPRKAGNELEINIKCYDPLVCMRGNGLNLSRATRMLMYECEWDHDGAEWDASDPHFLVNIPDTTDPGYDCEFVPAGIIHLESHRRTDLSDGKNDDHIEYAPGDYEYSASSKQIYFIGSQETLQDDGGDRVWTLKLYYYDPLDTDNSVKEVLTDILTAEPWSHQGGCGFDGADIDMKDIYGFDATGLTYDQWGYYYTSGTVKSIRKIMREKTEGPITQFLDELREAGLLPDDYWLRYDPQRRCIVGRYMLQDAALIYTPEGTVSNEQPCTLEGLAGRVECWARSGAMEDFALNSTITVNVPVIDDANSAHNTESYAEVSTNSGGTANLVDGKPDTMYSFWHEIKSEPLFAPQQTDEDAIVFELLDDDGVGTIKSIRRIQLTGGVPTNNDTPPVSYAPKDGKSRMYLIQRPAKVTISASESVIDVDNPGIPVGMGAVSVEMDPLNPGHQNGLDVDVECENIWQARYVAIRWEQDNYVRVDGNESNIVARITYFILSSVKILGDGRLRYRTGYDKGQTPYAQVSQQNGVITGIDVGNKTVTVSLTEVLTFAADDPCRFWDTTGGVPFTDDANVVVSVNTGTGDIVFTDTLPVGLAVGDKVGLFSRWRLDASSTWQDFCYPKLYRKLRNSSNWLEIVEDDSCAELADAEAVATEKLMEMIRVAKDHSMALPLDLMCRIGRTVTCYTSEDEWLVTKETFSMTPTDGSTPWVTMSNEGTNYEEVPE